MLFMCFVFHLFEILGDRALKLFKAPGILVNKDCSHLQSPLSIANLSVSLSYLLIKHTSLRTSQISNDCVTLYCMCIVYVSTHTCGSLKWITTLLTASIKTPQLSLGLDGFKSICITEVFSVHLCLSAKGCELTYFIILFLNSLWPSDAIWQHRSRSTLAQIMYCCLMASSH